MERKARQIKGQPHNPANPFHRNHLFPWAACLTDSVRGTIAVRTPQEILRIKERLEAEDGKDGFAMVRINNKYNSDVRMAFRNFMLNVRLRIDHFDMIGEIQLTTVDSLKLKKVQHKIYQLLRIFRTKLKTATLDDKVAVDIHTEILKNGLN